MDIVKWITDPGATSWGFVCIMLGVGQLLDDKSDLPKWFSTFLVCIGVIRIVVALAVAFATGA